MTAVARPWYSLGKRGPSRYASSARSADVLALGEPALRDLLAERARSPCGARSASERASNRPSTHAYASRNGSAIAVGRDLERAQHRRGRLLRARDAARRRLAERERHEHEREQHETAHDEPAPERGGGS